jgi:hypothetical protein
MAHFIPLAARRRIKGVLILVPFVHQLPAHAAAVFAVSSHMHASRPMTPGHQVVCEGAGEGHKRMRSAWHASSLRSPAHGSKRGRGRRAPLQDKVAGARAQAGRSLGVKNGTERVGRWLTKLDHAQVLHEIHAQRAAVHTQTSIHQQLEP